MNLTKIEKLTILSMFVETIGENITDYIPVNKMDNLIRILSEAFGNITMNEAREVAPKLIAKLVNDVIEDGTDLAECVKEGGL